MKRRFLTAVAVFGLLLAAGQAVALLLDFQPGQVLKAVDLNAIVSALTGGVDPTPIDVNCAAGDKIMNVLPKALPGSTIRLSGTCMEGVIIHTPRLTLDGQNSTFIEGGSVAGIHIAGVRGVRVMNLAVRNSSLGISSVNGAFLTLSNVIVQNNSGTGVLIQDNATAFLTDSQVENNGLDGVAVQNKSSVTIQGSTLGATKIKNNGEDGILIKNGSSANIFNATVEGNKEDGISIDKGSSAEIGNTTVQNNGISSTATTIFSGISVEKNSSADIRTSTITNNKTDGVMVEGASSASIDSSTITNNTEVGVSVENGSIVTIRGSTVQGHTVGHDLEAVFGALLTIENLISNTLRIDCRQFGLARVNPSSSPLSSTLSVAGCLSPGP